jgi:hypothetical protein
MQNIQFTVSAQNNSNKVISSSEEKFIGIGKGNLIKLGEENTLYTIINKDKFSYIKSFNLIDSKTILIEEDIGINLQCGDCINISYKEYELMMIYEILNKGKNYNLNDELRAIDGILNIDISTGNINPTILKINDINNEGGVEQTEILERGKYITPPDNPVKFSCQNGSELEINLKYKECDNRTIIERTIQDINIKDNKTYIYLNYSLPPNIKNGKLYVEKHTLILDSPFLGNTQKNINYELFRNFTPHLRLPLLLKNSLSPDIILNKALLQIDEEISQIKNKLGL